MRRRDVLRSSVGALALAGLGGSAAALTDDASYAPAGEVAVENTQEVVATPDGSHVAVAAGSGFAMVDVTDPANPTVAAEVGGILGEKDDGPMNNIADVKVDGDRLLVSGPNSGQSEAPRAAVLYDIGDPASPERLDVLEVDHAIHNSFFLDGYAYLTVSDFEFEGPKIVDTAGDGFEVVSEFSITEYDEGWSEVNGFLRSCHDLYVQGDYMYLAQWDAGAFIVDVSDKTSPEVVGRAGGLDMEKLAQLESREPLLQVGYEPPGNAHYVAVDDDASHLYVGAESWDVTSDDDNRGAGGIDVYDITDKAGPEKLTTIHPPGAEDESFQGQFTTSHNFSLADGRLYTSWYYGGVKIHDVSDPANPERLTWWRQPEEARFWGTAVPADADVFVAGNMAGSVMTFPDEAGEMADPPGAFTPPEETDLKTAVDWQSLLGNESTTTTTTDATTTTTTDATTPTAEPTTSTTEPTTATTTEGTNATVDTDSDGSPGFGALTALAGLGVAGARLLGRDADDE